MSRTFLAGCMVAVVLICLGLPTISLWLSARIFKVPHLTLQRAVSWVLLLMVFNLLGVVILFSDQPLDQALSWLPPALGLSSLLGLAVLLKYMQHATWGRAFLT